MVRMSFSVSFSTRKFMSLFYWAEKFSKIGLFMHTKCMASNYSYYNLMYFVRFLLFWPFDSSFNHWLSDHSSRSFRYVNVYKGIYEIWFILGSKSFIKHVSGIEMLVYNISPYSLSQSGMCCLLWICSAIACDYYNSAFAKISFYTHIQITLHAIRIMNSFGYTFLYSIKWTTSNIANRLKFSEHRIHCIWQQHIGCIQNEKQM